mmetsp:Transcript_25932/g.83651  ORF Transcript_25932/g.83651 Transcript_25932/m.83651 type:complete len:387 (+) Transcript_25932:74-1234(+)
MEEATTPSWARTRTTAIPGTGLSCLTISDGDAWSSKYKIAVALLLFALMYLTGYDHYDWETCYPTLGLCLNNGFSIGCGLWGCMFILFALNRFAEVDKPGPNNDHPQGKKSERDLKWELQALEQTQVEEHSKHRRLMQQVSSKVQLQKNQEHEMQHEEQMDKLHNEREDLHKQLEMLQQRDKRLQQQTRVSLLPKGAVKALLSKKHNPLALNGITKFVAAAESKDDQEPPTSILGDFSVSKKTYFVSLLLLRGIFNAASVAYVAATLPERNYKKHLNFAQYLVSCIELPYVLLTVITTTCYSCFCTHLHRVSEISDNIESIAKFSCLQMLPKIAPTEVYDRLSRIMDADERTSSAKLLQFPVVICQVVILGSAAVLSFFDQNRASR